MSADWLELVGQRVLVAGGGGSLGAAVVDGFVDAGASVAAADMSEAGLESLDPGVVSRIRVDLSEPEAARKAVRDAQAALDGLDVFVHCVGINDRRPIEDYDASDWERFIAVNLMSAVQTATEALVGMKKQGYGRIVLFSSVAGRSGHKLHGPYAATKGAINQFMRVVAHESAADGVTANAVAPGYMETALTQRYLHEHPETRQKLVEMIPAGRFGALQEVVDPVLFLSSPRAGFITGQVLYIDGGRTII
jgi:NAD(P)-dependent dehydrogenase (short-subunit alcohol dehydrogenase family)